MFEALASRDSSAALTGIALPACLSACVLSCCQRENTCWMSAISAEWLATAISARCSAAQRRLRYRSVVDDEREIPSWIDDALARALDPDPARRQAALSEFVHALHHPAPDHLRRLRPALIARDPAKFWKLLAIVALLANLVLLQRLFGG